MSETLQKITAFMVGVIIAIASFALISSTQAGAWGYRYNQKPSQPNIAQVAIDKGNFTTLVAALQCTGLDKVVSSKYVKLTVFAPTDAAFGELNLNKDNVCSAFSTKQLRNILLYHVTWGKKDSSIVASRSSLWMLNWQKAPITANAKAPVGLNIANAPIAAVDIPASNGIIHVVSDVMLP